MRFYTNARAYGNKILYRWIESGVSHSRKVDFHPTLYLASNTPTEFKTIDGRYAKEIKCGNINDCKKFMKQYEDVHGFEIFGNAKWQYQFLGEEYPDKLVKWDINQLCIAELDIEVDSSSGFPNMHTVDSEITLIGCRMNGITWVYGTGDYKPKADDVKFVKCHSEYDMLMSFKNRWSERYPDIITGWNTDGFDIPYLIRRMYKVLGEKMTEQMSPWGIIHEREYKSAFGKDETKYEYDILGISSIDYLAAYKKFRLVMRESYKLDYIAEVELGENKVDYQSLGYKSLHDLYIRNYELFVDYNIQDVALIGKLEHTLKIIQTILMLAYMSKINLEDPFFQVRMWDALIYNELMTQNIVIPQPMESSKDSKYEGAYVKEPVAGLYEWVASFDLDGLYPHLMMQYNISPETFVEPHDVNKILRAGIGSVSVDSLLNEEHDLSMLKKYNLTMTPNGQFFRTDVQGFLPKMLQGMYNERKAYKQKMLEAETNALKATTPEEKRRWKDEQSHYKLLQNAMKVTLNSAYGAVGNNFFRFYDVRQASAVTTAGQLSIRWVEKHINQYMNKVLKTEGVEYVIYVDTDSNYVCMKSLVDRTFAGKNPTTEQVINFMDKVCEEKIKPVIDAGYDKLADYVNAFEQKMSMKRECLADKAIWQGKKRYIMNVYDSEGVRYAEPKLKIMGIEIIKSSTPAVCRSSMKDAVRLMLNGTEKDVQKYIKTFKKQFFEMAPEQIAFPRGLNNLTKYVNNTNSGLYVKGTPIHVRGSILYNHLLIKNGVSKKYSKINETDRIRFVYMKEPNPIRENVLAFIDTIPPEFGLDNYIDYELQFEKTYLEPLKAVLNCIGWQAEARGSLLKFAKKK